MVSIFFKEEILACQEQEAKAVAEAITAVTELYDVPLASEKTIAWTNLAMVLGTVEGTRIAAMLTKYGKKRGPKAPDQPRQQMGVVDMPSKAHPNPPKQPISPMEAAMFTGSGAGTM